MPFGTGPTTFLERSVLRLIPSTAGYGASGRPSRRPRSAIRLSAPRSGAVVRPASLVYMKGPSWPACLANNVWSFGGTSGLGGTRYNTFLTQPFANYNFGKGWVRRQCPIITANWPAAGNKAWTLPVGANVGRVVKIGGKLPVNLSSAPTTTRCVRNSARPGSSGRRSH